MFKTWAAPTQQEVAEQTGADRMMTSKLVRTMEERGLLVRRPHASDARSLHLSLTPAGRDLVRQATQAARDVDALFFGAESATLRATLRRIAEHRGPNDQ
jgi:DNA-binding MarR family transcriptional regulator